MREPEGERAVGAGARHRPRRQQHRQYDYQKRVERMHVSENDTPPLARRSNMVRLASRLASPEGPSERVERAEREIPR